MTPDELRALADALSNGTHFVESPELHEAMLRAADYLRAQADAHPAPAAPQAEPKREPLSDKQIDDALLRIDSTAAFALMDSGNLTASQFTRALRRLVRVAERAHGIGGSDE